MKPGNVKRRAWDRTRNLMQKYGDGTPFKQTDLVGMNMTEAEAKSQILMFKRRGMIKTVRKEGRAAVYKLTRKTFRNEKSRKHDAPIGKLVAKRIVEVIQPSEIFVAINGSKLTVDAPGLIFELVGKIHLKLDT